MDGRQVVAWSRVRETARGCLEGYRGHLEGYRGYLEGYRGVSKVIEGISKVIEGISKIIEGLRGSSQMPTASGGCGLKDVRRGDELR